MTDNWYDLIDATAPLTQGDLIFDCPVLTWQSGILSTKEDAFNSEILQNSIDAIAVDVVVMTQACDLEQENVENVILCPHVPLDEHQSVWDSEKNRIGQNPTPRAWKSHCGDICKGFIFNLTMLNRCQIGESNLNVRIVYFHEIFTLPRSILESLLESRSHPRFRLLPPYREHLSQAFARFFMRVGLPISIENPWQT